MNNHNPPPKRESLHPTGEQSKARAMKSSIAFVVVAALSAAFALSIQPSVHADTFGSGENTFTIDFVDVGNGGNAPDTTTYGAVPYDYRIGKYEISQDAITKATASGMANVTAGAWSDNQPAADISWLEAAAFVNWLNTSIGKQAAYNLVWDGSNWNMTPWNREDSWQAGGENSTRHKDAFYFIPNEDEWYKAAYFNPAGPNYFLYATASDSPPTPVASGTDAGTAVYDKANNRPAAVTAAGGLSPYGTMGQGGNVWEITESGVHRGGNFWDTQEDGALLSSTRSSFAGQSAYAAHVTGFRVASLAAETLTGPLDSDGDGVNDYREMRDGTDPNDAQSSNALSRGLVAYYPFNGNADDESGYGFHGTLFGEPVAVVDRHGSLGSAFYFNGSNCYVDVGQPLGNNPQNLTQAAWYKFSEGEGGVLISKRQTEGAGWASVALLSNRPRHYLDDPGYIREAVGRYVSADRWVFICSVKRGETYEIYVNGVLEDWFVDSRAMQGSSEPMQFMRHIWTSGSGATTKGALDDVRLYNRALSSAEVARLFLEEGGMADNNDHDGDGVNDYREVQDGTDPQDSNSYSSLSKGLIAYFPFNNSFADESGLANDLVNRSEGIELTTGRSGQTNGALLIRNKASASSANNLEISGNQKNTIAFWYRSYPPGPDVTRFAAMVVGLGAFGSNEGGRRWCIIDEQPGGSLGVQFWGNWADGGIWLDGKGDSFREQWHHIAYVHEGTVTGTKIYIDGVLQSGGGYATKTDVLDISPSPLLIGEWEWWEEATRPDRSISDLRIYNRALSEQEMMELYAAESTPVAENLLVNGSFEQPVVEDISVSWNKNWITFGPNYAVDYTGLVLPGWRVTSGEVDVNDASSLEVSAAEGVQFLDLDGRMPGAIAQELSVIPGQRYQLRFKYGRYSAASMLVTVQGEATGPIFSKAVTASSDGSWPGPWDEEGGEFTADGSTATIIFTSTSRNQHAVGMKVDDVRVYADRSDEVGEDLVAPTIELIGENPMEVSQGSEFSDPGAVVTDNVDPDRTIMGTGTVDTLQIGSYTLTYNASDTSGNNAIPVTRAVNVVELTPPGPVDALVVLGNLSHTFDGTAKIASAVTTPEGLAVSITYDGNAEAPVNAGTYAVVATINDPNYEGSASGDLVIGKATASVVLGDLVQGFDGSAKTATATTTPEGLTVDLTYDGSSTAPTGAGTYAVVATINDTNYEGSASGDLVIGKAAASVVLGDLVQGFDGSAKTATARTTPEGLTVELTYDGSSTAPTSLGTYAVSATINDPNYEGSASADLVIGKGTASIAFGDLAQTYDGTTRTVSVTTTPEGLTVNLTYDGNAEAPTGAGSYDVVATVDDANYEGSARDTLVIAKATVLVTLADLAATYDGSAKTVSVMTDPPGFDISLTYDGSTAAPTSAGSYAVAASVNDPNYEGSANETLIIAKAAAEVVLGDLSHTFDGSAKVASAVTTPAGLGVALSYNGSDDAPVNAGTYEVMATIDDPNYTGTAAGSLTIGKAAASIVLGDLVQTYDGSAKGAAATTTPEGLEVVWTYDGSSTVPVNAGSYEVGALVDDPNYVGSAAGTLVIGKATAGIVLDDLAQAYDGSAKTASATTTPEGLGVSFTYDGVEEAPVNVGTYTVAAAVNDPNHTGSADGTLVIGKGTQSITFAAIDDQDLGGASLVLSGSSSSGLAPTFSVVSGPASISGDALTLQGLGTVVVRASQGGDANWLAAPPVERSFRVFAGDFPQSYVWASGFGGSGYDTAYAVAPEAGGGAYLIGDFENSVTFGSSSFTVNGGNFSDLVVLKVDGQGAVLWARQYGGANSDFAKAVVALPSGGLVAGAEFTTSTAIGGITLNSAGSRDIALFKVNDDGTFGWARSFGGTSSDSLHSMAVDDAGNIYIAGQFSGDITFGSNPALSSSGSSDGFVAKLSPDGTPIWSRRLGGSGADIAYTVAVRADGSVGVAGSFNGGATFGSITLTSLGSSDGFAALLDTEGTFQWAKRFGGTTADSARSVAFDGPGDLWVSGSFTGSAASGFVSNLASAGAEDVFVMRLASSDGAPGEAYRFGGTGSETALSLSADPYGSVILGGSFQGQVAFGSSNLTSAGLSDTFVAKIRAGRGAIWALRGGGANDDRSQSVAVNSNGEIFHAGLFGTQAAFGPSLVSGGGSWDLFVSKINGPFPTFTGLVSEVSADEGDSLTLDALVLSAEPLSLQWFKDGSPIAGATSALLSIASASPADAGEYHLEGTNAYGASSSLAVLVTVRVPDQVVSLEAAPDTAENRRIEAPVYLESAGDVSGITIVIPYDKNYLSNADFDLGPHFVAGNSSIVVDKDAGTVRVVGNAFPSTVPEGRSLLGTFRATTRSVPEGATVSFLPSLSSISDVFGGPIESFTKINGANVRIAQRDVPGDANNNGRLDVADAAELIRLYGTPSLIRSWDHFLNDLNGDGILTEGDAIRVLRVAAALDDVPAFPSAAPRSMASRSLRTTSSVQRASSRSISSETLMRTLSIPSAPSARLVLTRLTGANANKVMAQIYVDGLPADQAGLSFTVSYPATLLRIADSSSLVTPPGGLPSSALRIWNVLPENSYADQTGTVTFVVAAGSPFGFDPAQSVANIVFDVQPSATAQVHFPVVLSDVEAAPHSAEDPADPFALTGQTAVFTRTYADWALANLGSADASALDDRDGDGESNGSEFAASTDPVDASSRLRTTSMERGQGGFMVRWFAAYGVNYRLSASTDLKTWAPVSDVIAGQGAEESASDPTASSSARKFYRVEVVSP